MFQDRIFRNCLLFSAAIHAIVLFNIPHNKIFFNLSSPKKIEVTYFKKIDYQKNINRLPANAIAGNKEKITTPALLAKNTSFGKVKLEEKIAKPNIKTHKVIMPATKKLQLSKTVILPTKVLKDEKILISYNSKDLSNEPPYLKYHNIVRAKIEQMANANKPYIFKVGEVSLVFTILNNGDLKTVALVDKNSVSDTTLRQCALDSVYAASPFPPFTQEMKEDHLTLQVAISFEK